MDKGGKKPGGQPGNHNAAGAHHGHRGGHHKPGAHKPTTHHKPKKPKA